MTSLRVLTLLVWLPVVVIFFPAVVRCVRGVQAANDEYRSAIFFFAVLLIGFVGRWLLMPGNENVFLALYSVSIALAVYVMLICRRG